MLTQFFMLREASLIFKTDQRQRIYTDEYTSSSKNTRKLQNVAEFEVFTQSHLQVALFISFVGSVPLYYRT